MITIALARDVFVKCKVIEDLGFSHDAGHFAKIVEYQDEERVAVKRNGHIWRFWTAEDRVGHGHRASKGVGQ